MDNHLKSSDIDTLNTTKWLVYRIFFTKNHTIIENCISLHSETALWRN